MGKKLRKSTLLRRHDKCQIVVSACRHNQSNTLLLYTRPLQPVKILHPFRKSAAHTYKLTVTYEIRGGRFLLPRISYWSGQLLGSHQFASRET